MKQFLMKNWKTTIAALACAVVAYLTSAGKLDASQATLATSVLGALGFAAAKDGDVSGNGKDNPGQ